jgi:hypothetical protein
MESDAMIVLARDLGFEYLLHLLNERIATSEFRISIIRNDEHVFDCGSLKALDLDVQRGNT